MDVVVAFFLTLSLASERLVTICKTAVPWLSTEVVTSSDQPDPYADRARRLSVQLIAFAASYLTGAVTTNTVWPLEVSKVGDYSMPLWGIALLASGGSAFWNSVLGYTRAAKEAQQALEATRKERLHDALREARPIATRERRNEPT